METNKASLGTIYDPIHDDKGKIIHNWNLDNLLMYLFKKNIDLASIYSDGDNQKLSSYVDYSHESIIKAIRIVMGKKNISLRKLSRLMDTSPSYVCSFLNMRYAQSMQIYTLERICRAMKVPVLDVLLIAREIVLSNDSPKHVSM